MPPAEEVYEHFRCMQKAMTVLTALGAIGPGSDDARRAAMGSIGVDEVGEAGDIFRGLAGLVTVLAQKVAKARGEPIERVLSELGETISKVADFRPEGGV